jgi:hypothetical protein
LYVASSENLHDSIDAQQRLVDVDLFEPDLWQPKPDALFWRYAALPDSPSTLRYGLVNELVGSLLPVFNIPRHRSAA